MASYGTVYLNGIQFDLDPEDYRLVDGGRFGSIHELVDGTRQFQDFGWDITHAIIEMSGVIINQATLNAMTALYTTNPAPQMRLQDWMGNDMTVIFTPGTTGFAASVIRGATSAWTFTLNLSVTAAAHYVGLTNPA